MMLATYIAVVPATATDRSKLDTLLARCLAEDGAVGGWAAAYDASELEGYWRDPNLRPLQINVGEQVGGFALVHHRSRLHANFEGHAIGGLFLLREHRRLGIGQTAAVQLFDLFPGRWEIATSAVNVPGHTFWRAVVDRYTAGRYHETWHQTASWRGPIQSFSTPAARLPTSRYPR